MTMQGLSNWERNKLPGRRNYDRDVNRPVSNWERTAVGGQANPVGRRPSLGRWFKSQLPGGEKAMGFKQLGQALTSPAMLLGAAKLSPLTGPAASAVEQVTGLYKTARDPRRLYRNYPPVRAAESLLGWAESGAKLGEKVPGVGPAAHKAGELIKQSGDWIEEGVRLAANPVAAVRGLTEEIKDAISKEDEGKAEGPSGWYPVPSESWSGEPGGNYLSQRYPREFGTWGVGTPGEGWNHIAMRGGWDKHLHPNYGSEFYANVLGRPYQVRSGRRAYLRY